MGLLPFFISASTMVMLIIWVLSILTTVLGRDVFLVIFLIFLIRSEGTLVEPPRDLLCPTYNKISRM